MRGSEQMAILGGAFGLASLMLAYWGWRRVRTPEAGLWALALIALAGWALSESLVVAPVDPRTRLLGLRIQALGVAAISPLFLLGALRYSGALLRLRPHHGLGIFLIPALTVLLALTNEAHHLVWATLEVRPDGALAVAYGPWFWIHTAFAIFAFLSALAFMLPSLIHGVRTSLWMISAFALALTMILVALFIRLYDPSYTYLSTSWRGATAGMLGLAAVLLGSAFQALPAFQPIPLARSLLIEGMAEGMLVLDRQGRVVDVNAPMAQWLGRPPSALFGRPLAEAAATWPELRDALSSWWGEGQTRTAEIPHPALGRWFLLSAQPIGRPGEPIGGFVLVREVTAAKQQALRRARQQEALVRLATDPQIWSGDLETAMARIAWIAAEALEVSRVNIWRLDEHAGRLECLIHVEWPTGISGKGMVLPVADYPAYFEALRKGWAIDAADARRDPRTCELRESYLEPFGVFSLLDAPIRYEDRVVGVICHEQVGRIRAWTPDEVTFAGAVADLIARAWVEAERRAAEERARRYAQQLQLLQQISQELFRTEDLPRFYALTLQGILEIVGADRAAILLRDPDGVVRFKAWQNLSEEYRQAVEGHWPWDPSDPNPSILWIADVAQASELGDVREAVLREGIRALAFVPIRGEGQALGKLMLYYDRPHAPDEETQRLAQTLADAVAAALRRHRETWLWEAMAEALREVMNSPPEFTVRVRVILRAIRRLLRADRAGLWFYEPTRQQVACAGAEGLSAAYIQWLLESYRQVPGVRAIKIPTAIHISDVRTDPRTEGTRERLLQEGFRAYAVFPLWAPAPDSGQLPFRGVLTVYWDAPHSMGPEELFMGQAFANAAAQALASAYLFEETQRRARQEAALNRVMAAILQAEDLDQIMRIGLEQAQAVMGFQMGEIHLWEDGAGVLRLRAASGIPDEGRRMMEVCRPGEGVIGRAFAAGHPLVYSDLPREAPELHSMLPFPEARAWVSLPLRAGARVLGVLSLFDVSPHLFSEEELNLLQALANHLALAVERTALLERMADQVREVSLLYEASANLLAARDVETVVKLLGRFLCEITGGLVARFHRYRPETDALEPIAEYMSSGAPAWLPWIEEVRKLSLSLRETVLRERRPYTLWISEPDHPVDAAPSPSPLRFEEEQALRDLGVRRLMVLPLTVGNKMLGLAEVWDPRGEGGFTISQIALSHAIVNHAAVALENARLLELLSAERSRLRTLIDAAVDGIVLVGADGRILELNRAAVDLLDLRSSPASWVGRSLLDGIRGLRRDQPSLARTLIHHWRRMREGLAEIQTIEFDTETRSLRIQVVPIRGGEGVIGWLGMIYDMTPARALERMREELFHMIVHDLRNPVASVQTALEFLLGEGLGALSREQREVLTIARDNLGRMLGMINSILELRRLQAGERILQPQAIPLSALVAGLLRELSILIREKSLWVDTEIPDELPPVWGDEQLLTRVFQNLLDNAIKFTPSGGRIWIQAVRMQEGKGTWVKVTVADSGPGVPQEMREAIFKPFVTGKIRGRGVGLGLAFCKLAVEAHGGRIWVEDAPEGGAAFVFTLPVAPSEEPSMEPS